MNRFFFILFFFMFVLIGFQPVINRFRFSITNIKRIVNFLFDSEVLDYLIIQMKKAHDILVSVLRFFL